jgi:hypothetical protein
MPVFTTFTRGVLGAFPQPADAEHASTSPAAGRGILGMLDRWSDPHSSSAGHGIPSSGERTNYSEDQFDSAAPSFASDDLLSTSNSVPWASRQTGRNEVRLAGMTDLSPGSRLPVAPPFPGTPEWTDHFIRSWQGLFDAIRRPKRKKIDESECDAQYERDLFQCKMVGLPECYAQAMERRAACLAGRPIPPFNY